MMEQASLARVRRWFQQNAGRTRVMALMSPTCGFCMIGDQAVRTYHAWLPDAELATLRIWVPMMANDQEHHARKHQERNDDPRITDLYDGEHHVARGYRDRLSLAAAAWDTYMLFQPHRQWDGEPPMPDEHQYQLYPSYAPDQSRLFTPSSFWWQVVEATGGSRASYDARVPALAAWLNDDPRARIGSPVPDAFAGTRS